MRRTTRITAAVAIAAAMASGCTDRVPTLTDPDEFPLGLLPTTIEYIIDAPGFLLDADVYSAGTGEPDFPRLVIARDFDNELHANALARFGPFPDTIIHNNQRDGDFQYVDSRVVGLVPDSLSASRGELTFYLWTIAQPWDTATVNWEFAENSAGSQVRWTTPGGTRGELLDAVRWISADTTAIADSLIFEVPSSVMSQLANDEVHGLMVTMDIESDRVEISGLSLQASIRPSVDTDTIITRTIGQGRQLFIFTPDAPHPDQVMRVGGLESERTVLRLAIPDALPACSLGSTCGTVSPDSVTLNRIDLLLDPVAPTSGFRPVAPFPLTMRRVHEVELGERAPLGQLLASNLAVPANDFLAANEFVSVVITGLIADAIAADSSEVALALLVEPEASRFDYAWFSRNPRFRFVYTLPTIPQLP